MQVLKDFDLENFWDNSEFSVEEYIDEPLSDVLLDRVEKELGYKLPNAYVELCRSQNGGEPRKTCHRIDQATSWAADHVAISNIKAIGFKNTWALCGEIGQVNALKEWGYPPIGVYFADCPSGGHDHLCLDYRTLNDDGEPCVVHVDQEFNYKITRVAPTFEAFLLGLESEAAFD
jgi:hypothetical protein